VEERRIRKPARRPKESRNYKTLFREAYVAIARDLRLGKDPDVLFSNNIF
jgi:hypothetical protein